MNEWLNIRKWMYEYMNKWMYEWMNNEYINNKMNVCINEWMYERM